MQLLLQALTYHRGSDEPLSVLLIVLVRVTLVLATGWLASRALSRASAAVQHCAWLLTVLGTLAVPLLWAMTPGWRVPLVTVHVAGDNLSSAIGTPPISVDSSWPALVLAVWITGSLVALCYTLLGIIFARRLFGDSAPCHDRQWLELLAEAQRTLGLSRQVDLRVTRRRMSPAVWSFRRVQILLPADSLAWPAATRRSVLLHELAHVARRDCATQLLAGLASAAWWFHPLVWYASAQLRATSELAADDYVIRASGRRADYAAQLLAIVAALDWHHLPEPAQAMFHPSHLERRVRAILDPARRRNLLGRRRSTIGIALALVLTIPLATLTPSAVRAVPRPPAPQVPARLDVRWQLRVSVPARPVLLPDDYRRQPLPQSELVPLPQPPTEPVLPQGRFELIPNWEAGRSAAMLIPNYELGTAKVVPVEPVKASLARMRSTASDQAPVATTTIPLAAPGTASSTNYFVAPRHAAGAQQPPSVPPSAAAPPSPAVAP